MLRIIEINSIEKLIPFKNDWDGLLAENKSSCIFQTWEWITTWWKHYGNEKTLCILLIINEHNTIQAIAPLMMCNRKYYGKKLKVIQFIGANQSDYMDFVTKRIQPEFINIFLEYIMKKEIDLVDFNAIQEDSLSNQYIKKYSIENKLILEKYTIESSPCISLPNDWDSYYSSLSKKKRKNLSRCEKLLKESCKVNFVKIQNPDDVERSMEIFMKMHINLWESTSHGMTFTNQAFKHFNMEISKILAYKNSLYLAFIKNDDAYIASFYGFIYNGRLYYYLPSYDPKYSIYSPGNILTMYSIQDSIKIGLTSFDFLRGSESYKQSWNVRNNTLVRTLVGKRTLSSIMFFSMRRIRKRFQHKRQVR